jgi:hypothetical protein
MWMSQRHYRLHGGLLKYDRLKDVGEKKAKGFDSVDFH